MIPDPPWKNGDDLEDLPEYLDHQPDDPVEGPWDEEVDTEEDDDYDAALDEYDKELERLWREGRRE